MPGSRLRRGFDGLRSRSAEALAKAGTRPGNDENLRWNRRPLPALSLPAGFEEKLGTGDDEALYAVGWILSGLARLGTIVAVWMFGM
jgi:hypothetical protein